ncbi:MAG: hypothetical protein L3K26_05890 [Candidatus Hydrogenedentes bacterium]|nr:hypothetical protein [Candidatus Hydrogenedentota bacterium]
MTLNTADIAQELRSTPLSLRKKVTLEGQPPFPQPDPGENTDTTIDSTTIDSSVIEFL